MSFKNWFKPSPRKAIEREITESEMLLLQAHSNKEHWEAVVELHTKKLERLRTSWNARQELDKQVNRKDSNVN